MGVEHFWFMFRLICLALVENIGSDDLPHNLSDLHDLSLGDGWMLKALHMK